MPTAALNSPRTPPLKTAGAVGAVVIIAIVAVLFLQFRGDFRHTTPITVIATRAGLVMELGGKVTYNGVAVGRVGRIDAITINGEPKAKLTLDVDSKYINQIPANVDTDITASTVFGNKYVSFRSPKNPAPQPLSRGQVINASSVTVEFNTLFETVMSIAEKIDPVKLNETLSSVAQALDGLGERFGQSLSRGNQILGDINPQMGQIRSDVAKFGQLADIYSDASADLWGFLSNAVTTVHTLNQEQRNLDAALLAAAGLGNTGAPVLDKSAPFFVRATQDLVPTSQLLDTYSPEIYCLLHNYAKLAPIMERAVGGANGYSLQTNSAILGGGNPYVYPDNLPRVNAHGGPEGKPGCWAPITRDLWPAPYLVMDTGAASTPYNHFGLGQPLTAEYVWGRQVGENTINP